jgi:hypothetical protein
MPKIHEFRVRAVTRYVVTEFVSYGGKHCGSRPLGQFEVLNHANDVAESMAKAYGGQAFPLDDPKEVA